MKLLQSLKAEPSQFRIAVPPSIKIDCEKYKNEDRYADYKYYLAIYDEETLKKIVESMSFAEKQGKTVKYRPHPRYSNKELLRKYVKEEEIEWYSEVPILESISNLGCAVGSFTTVMVQAYFSGKKVLMDDVAKKEEYDKLQSLDYILSGDEFDKLSDMQ